MVDPIITVHKQTAGSIGFGYNDIYLSQFIGINFFVHILKMVQLLCRFK